MRALVTGATGFIGAHVARDLLAHGWEVRALARPGAPRGQLADVGTPAEHLPRVEWVEGDMLDRASLDRAAPGCDAAFHVAAAYSLWTRDPDGMVRTNVEGTRNVLEAARAAGVPRVVYTSSVSCVGEAPPGGLASEDTTVHPEDLVGPYKRSKWEAEGVARAAAEAGQDVVIVNPASVIGPGDRKPTPTGKLIVDFLRGDMPAYVETGLNFVDVRDVAAGHRLAFERGAAGRRYILGNLEGNRSLREFLEVLAGVCGRRAPRLRIPYAVAWTAGAVSTWWADHVTHQEPGIPLAGVKMSRHRMFFDPRRAVAELGLPQTPLEATLRDAVAWFRAHLGCP